MKNTKFLSKSKIYNRKLYIIINATIKINTKPDAYLIQNLQ